LLGKELVIDSSQFGPTRWSNAFYLQETSLLSGKKLETEFYQVAPT